MVSGHSPRTYLGAIRAYLIWLEQAPVDGDRLNDVTAKDWAVRVAMSCATPSGPSSKWAELHLVHHSADPVNTRRLRRSVWPYGALGLPGCRAAMVTRDFTGRLDLMQP
jgi:hypothetical protein